MVEEEEAPVEKYLRDFFMQALQAHMKDWEKFLLKPPAPNQRILLDVLVEYWLSEFSQLDRFMKETTVGNPFRFSNRLIDELYVMTKPRKDFWLKGGCGQLVKALGKHVEENGERCEQALLGMVEEVEASILSGEKKRLRISFVEKYFDNFAARLNNMGRKVKKYYRDRTKKRWLIVWNVVVGISVIGGVMRVIDMIKYWMR